MHAPRWRCSTLIQAESGELGLSVLWSRSLGLRRPVGVCHVGGRSFLSQGGKTTSVACSPFFVLALLSDQSAQSALFRPSSGRSSPPEWLCRAFCSRRATGENICNWQP